MNSTIYSHLESNLSMTLNDDTREAMERVYGGLIGNNGGTVTTLSKEEMDKLLKSLPEGTSELRKNIVLQAGRCSWKIPYYWGGAASCAGYEGNHFGTVITPVIKEETEKDWTVRTLWTGSTGQ